MTNTIVLIGAGSAMFGLRTLGDVFNCSALQGSHIVLHDVNAQSLTKVRDIALRAIQERELPFTLSATTLRQHALKGANFCIISIEVGDRFELWEQDWRIPVQHGLRQVFGENGGPGGLFHSLRIIPPILEIAQDINAICPDAYVINYSNPMSRVCLAMKRRYPDLKVVGLCHEVRSLTIHLPRILETPLSNLSFKAGGLNHFSVLLEVNYKDSGEDAYPDVRARAPTYFADAPSARETLADNPADARGRTWKNRWLFKEILERFGYLPITEDSHFGEYVHWAYEVADHKEIHDFYTWYKKWAREKALTSHIEGISRAEGWSAVSIIEGILTDSQHEELAVNISNDGLIDNLPRDLVVEVPAKVDKDGVRGIKIGALPKGIAGLLANQVAVHDLTVEAALTGSRRVALQALLVDPLVDSLCAAEKTLNAILELQKPYLGYLK